MVGDTLETDILGAENANKSMNCNIDSILVMTGMTARSMQDNERSDVFLMKKFFNKKGNSTEQTAIVSNQSLQILSITTVSSLIVSMVFL